MAMPSRASDSLVLWTLTSASARSARRFHWAIARSFSASARTCPATKSFGGPRLFGASAPSIVDTACVRQFAICDAYRPSLRSNAPSRPVSLHTSACCKIRFLYSAVNVRRLDFPVTSKADLSIAMGNHELRGGGFFTPCDYYSNHPVMTVSSALTKR